MKRYLGVLAWMASAFMQGCAVSTAILEAPQEYIHQLDYSLNGVQYSVKRRLSCSSSMSVLSAADGRFHNQWAINGYNPEATVSIGENMTLLYQLTAPCNQARKDWPTYVLLIDDLERPDRLIVFSDQSEVLVAGSRVKIQSLSSYRATQLDADVPLASDKGAAVDLTKYRQRIYERVTATILPESVWARSTDAREYLSQLSELTVADSATTGTDNVQFPIFKKIAGYSRTEVVSLGLIFKDGEYLMPNADIGSPYLYWYAAGRKGANEQTPYNKDWVTINYKGKRLRVKTGLQLFDPQTKQLISFLRTPKL